VSHPPLPHWQGISLHTDGDGNETTIRIGGVLAQSIASRDETAATQKETARSEAVSATADDRSTKNASLIDANVSDVVDKLKTKKKKKRSLSEKPESTSDKSTEAVPKEEADGKDKKIKNKVTPKKTTADE
jgi:hypothetical protein